jgi:hypothetical protein
VAFNTHQVFQGPGLALLNDLNLVEAGSGQLTRLLPPGQGGMFYYSPDGRQVAISQSARILLANADGSSIREALAHPQVATYSEYLFYAEPVWSPDGTFLRVAIPPADPLAPTAEPTALWTIAASDAQAVQSGSVMAVPFFDQAVSFSPDLQRLAAVQAVGAPAENRRELHLAAYDGGGDWVYAQAPMLRFAGWAPAAATPGAAAHFFYILGEDQSAWLGSLDATPAPLFAEAYGIQHLQWVDAQRYLFTRQRAESFDLYLGVLSGEPLQFDTVTGDPPAFDFVVLP